MKPYNQLNGQEAEFATKNKLGTKEWSVKVKGMRKRPDSDVSKVAGNGEYGFHARRQGKDPVKFVGTPDGTLKKARKSVVRPNQRKSRCFVPKEYLGTFNIMQILIKESSKPKSVIKLERKKRTRNRRANYGRNKAV